MRPGLRPRFRGYIETVFRLPIDRRLLPQGPLILLLLLAVLHLSTAPPAGADAPSFAAVSLGADASCDYGQVEIDSTATSAPAREAVIATTSLEPVPLVDLEQASTIGSSYSGPFNYPFPAAQPTGTRIGLYGYLGETPPSAAGTSEFFVVYACDTAGANEVVNVCSGPYGTCPQRILQASVVEGATTEIAAGGTVGSTGQMSVTSNTVIVGGESDTTTAALRVVAAPRFTG